jgi:transposase
VSMGWSWPRSRGHLVWAQAGRDMKTLGGFFDALGEQRCQKITLVSADGATWIAGVVKARCPKARLCMDPFHEGSRYALWKNPEDLTANQTAKLSGIAKTNKQLYRAYLLKEQFRQVFQLRGEAGIAMLKAWLAWACRCQIPAFVTLAGTIRDYRPAIEAALTQG